MCCKLVSISPIIIFDYPFVFTIPYSSTVRNTNRLTFVIIYSVKQSSRSNRIFTSQVFTHTEIAIKFTGTTVLTSVSSRSQITEKCVFATIKQKGTAITCTFWNDNKCSHYISCVLFINVDHSRTKE